MNNLGSNTSAVCKYEILAEISIHNNTPKKETTKVLCSRILAKHRPRWIRMINFNYYFSIHIIVLNLLQINWIKGFALLQHSYKYNRIYLKLYVVRHCKYINCSQEVESSIEDESIQEKFMNLSTDESQQHAKWYEYWENNGENFVCETWIQQYGCSTMDDTIDIEELYKKHREEQYQILYWKFINEIGYTDAKIEEQTNKDM